MLPTLSPLTLLGILGIVLLTTRCGKTCVMGIGDCDYYRGASIATPTPTASALSLSVSASTVKVSQTVVFTASGGTSPYTFSIVSGTGILVPNDNQATLTPTATGQVTVKVTESQNNTAQQTVTVNAS